MKNIIKKTLFTAVVSSFAIITIIGIFLIVNDMMHSETKSFLDSLYYVIDYHFIGYDDCYTSGRGINVIAAIILLCTIIPFGIFSCKEN